MKIKRNYKGKELIYEYEKVGDYNLINPLIKKDFAKFCKKFKINKSKLIEEFYKTILLRERFLNMINSYVTINILRPPIVKSA